ncbi:hypothetical protein ACOBQX_19590 [Actinokineospora sp. G85]|uniref:hypothetical protein n=1 Tax=Actinokineospora sp. G85 TaxID=3406626 RepID=UPI003C751006
MAGDVFIGDDRHWAASSSMYNWVLDALIDHATTPTAKAALIEIRDASLGIIDLADDDYFAEGGDELLTIIATRLVPHAQRQFPQDMPARAAFLRQLNTLADLAGA